MKMNFKGLVDLHTLPKTTPLLPLYEAIINSIQSIEDAQISNGKIEIIVERDKQMNLFNQWETDIENIIIVDNGIGFDDENYNSFDTYASEYKIQKGCKGVGRMLWLKAFCSVSIESIFVEEDKKKCRTFLFDANHAVHDMKVKELSSDVLQTTKVRLNGLREQYKGNCPKKLDTIAKNILNHCFTYYVLGKAPKIIVSDEQDIIDIDELYKENIGDNIFNSEIKDEVILCLNYDGKFGLNNMNSYFQNANTEEAVIWKEWKYKVGDRILFNDTNRFSLLYNNLKGRIIHINKLKERIIFTVDIAISLTENDCIKDGLEFIDTVEDGTRIRFDVLDFDEEMPEENREKTIVPFQLAYAVSIHKAQGLEYQSVKVVIPSSNAEKITHGIFYTAITRAKEKLKIYWSSETMQEVITGFSENNLKQCSLDIIKEKLN